MSKNFRDPNPFAVNRTVSGADLLFHFISDSRYRKSGCKGNVFCFYSPNIFSDFFFQTLIYNRIFFFPPVSSSPLTSSPLKELSPSLKRERKGKHLFRSAKSNPNLFSSKNPYPLIRKEKKLKLPALMTPEPIGWSLNNG
jgi:hypothetical protein